MVYRILVQSDDGYGIVIQFKFLVGVK